MFYSFVLILHITTAILTGLLVSYIGITLWNHRSSSYRASALTLGILGMLEVLSGTVLAILSPLITAVSLSSHIVIYMSVVLAIETLLYIQMRKTQQLFPLTHALSPILAGLTLMAGAISFSF